MAGVGGPTALSPLQSDELPHETTLKIDLPLSNAMAAVFPHAPSHVKPQSAFPSRPSASQGQDDPGVSSGASKHTDEEVELGMKTSVKNLYRDHKSLSWDEWVPDNVDLNAEATSSWKQFALVVRYEMLEDRPSLSLHSISIQSPVIKDRLGVVFDSYKGIATTLKKLTFRAPFHEFFYRWDRFEQSIEDEKDEFALGHMKLLYGVISPEIKPHIERVQDFLINNVITFDYLWALFEPGIEAYTSMDGQHRLYGLVSSSYEQVSQKSTDFILACRYIDCDGSGFGYVSTSLAINEFDNVKPIPELSVLPSHLHPRMKAIRAELTERGRKFEQLNGFHYKAYSGFCIMNRSFFGGSNKRNIDAGRIIVDTKMYATYNSGNIPALKSLSGALDGPTAPVLEDDDIALPHPGPMYRAMMSMPPPAPLPPFPPPLPPPIPPIMGSMSRVTEFVGSTTLTEEQYALCTPMVRGYCLPTKQWVQFYVDNVRDIEWNDEAFKKLVLPLDYKKVIWAFVDSQLALGDKFDDVVQGKGQGVILLLTGEPGVGKTLTAESLAEEMRRPLYSMSAGELGHEADEVERNLQRALEISTKWGAVLLLDECDVFLEKRSAADIQRNMLVSVFLRLLEYYRGVLLLTTNRISAFDPAFESRIHLTIEYPKLDFTSRLHVWGTFVRPHDESSQYASNITERELEKLAAEEMNGRQIKNVVKTARLLAAREGRKLALEDVETVLRIKRGSLLGVQNNGLL
ncbi:Replication factor C large subunit [Lasiodiplodia hormozganensis]|uniref:Replication factor C large subunit n=1 Tax=Lasiodiplodia hormozganensis TaxID=869390 RepID=A0AA39U7G2_9PEZI|nr:Replication factor C large subunit [Lasiodiplodia hormozganensis]